MLLLIESLIGIALFYAYRLPACAVAGLAVQLLT